VARVGREGLLDLESLSACLDRTVSLVSVQLVNNEVGTLQPFSEVSRIVRKRAPAAVLHTDAVQAAPWFDVAHLAAGADMVSISAHKFGGPQGVGALALRQRGAGAPPLRLDPLLVGGPQERERRAGTHNVAGIAGMAAALQAAAGEKEAASRRVGALRDRLLEGLLRSVPGAHQTAAGTEKAPGHCHLIIDGVESEALLVLLDDDAVAASAGSACASGAMEPSHVLLAMGYTGQQAMSALRLTLGHSSTAADIARAIEVVPAAVSRLRDRGCAGGATSSPGPAGAAGRGVM
jgi:cysteine desulfurase